MARNPVALLYPYHRVVDANGALHQYAYGVEVKARLLEMEGYPTAGVAVAAGPSTR
jgi:methylated-DNA-[protein]-cysteine S-methyltransferase